MKNDRKRLEAKEVWIRNRIKNSAAVLIKQVTVKSCREYNYESRNMLEAVLQCKQRLVGWLKV